MVKLCDDSEALTKLTAIDTGIDLVLVLIPRLNEEVAER